MISCKQTKDAFLPSHDPSRVVHLRSSKPEFADDSHQAHSNEEQVAQNTSISEQRAEKLPENERGRNGPSRDLLPCVLRSSCAERPTAEHTKISHLAAFARLVADLRCTVSGKKLYCIRGPSVRKLYNLLDRGRDKAASKESLRMRGRNTSLGLVQGILNPSLQCRSFLVHPGFPERYFVRAVPYMTCIRQYAERSN